VSIGSGLGITEVLLFPGAGLALANGLTAQLSGTPSGAGVQVLYR